MEEDVLAATPLPAWSIFDALFISRHDHPEDNAEFSGSIITDTPIARIQKIRRRALLALGVLLLLSTCSRLYTGSYGYTGGAVTPKNSLVYSRSDVRRGSSASTSSSSSSRLRSPTIQHPSKPRRLRPSSQRLAILQSIVSSRRSSYSSTSFFESDTSSSITDSPPLAHQLVSAVIVHEPDWHLDNTQLVVELVSRYPFVREILVWNNDLDLQIDGQTLNAPSTTELDFDPPRLRVLNAPSSFSPLSSPIHRTLPPSHAKHLACALSNHQICLFLSPSSLPIHLDSLYSSYLSSGPTFNQIVSIVNAEDYHHLQHLVFRNEAVDLHTAPLFPALAGDGAQGPRKEMQETIVKKEWSRRFWKQLGTLTPDVVDEADVYWSIWMNTVPKLLVAPSLPFVEMSSQTPTAEDKTYQNTFILDALRSLYTVLEAQDPFMSPDPFPLAPSPPPSDARAPSHDDRCVFVTNLTPYKVQAGELPFQALSLRSKKGKPSSGGGVFAGFFGRLFGIGGQMQEAEAKRAPLTQAPLGNGKKPSFDPYTSISSIEEYEQLWLSASSSSSSSSDNNNVISFPSSSSEFKYSLSWYPAVNGRHPTSASPSNGTCWTSPSPPLKEDYFGLSFNQPIEVDGAEISVLGSKILGNIVGVGQEDLTAESWEIWTQAPSVTAPSVGQGAVQPQLVWSRRKLLGKVSSTRIGEGPYWRHTFTLAGVTTAKGRLEKNPSTDEDEEDEDETGEDTDFRVLKKRQLAGDTDEEDGAVVEDEELRTFTKPAGRRKAREEIHALKLVSSDRKNQRIRVCGWQIDDWVI